MLAERASCVAFKPLLDALLLKFVSALQFHKRRVFIVRVKADQTLVHVPGILWIELPDSQVSHDNSHNVWFLSRSDISHRKYTLKGMIGW